MSRSLTTLIAALALGVSTLAVSPASAMPVAGTAALDTAAPASETVEQVQFIRRGGYRRGFGVRRGYAVRPGYGYRRGLPGRPIRRILRAL